MLYAPFCLFCMLYAAGSSAETAIAAAGGFFLAYGLAVLASTTSSFPSL
jgi:hypothetical protein